MEVQFLNGKKEGSVIYHVGDGFYYHCDVRRRRVIYLKCIYYHSTGCAGRAMLQRDGFTHTGDHTTHNADVDYADELRLRQIILRRCKALEYTTFRRIVSEESRLFNREVRSRVTLVRLRTAMRNARLAQFPPPPRDLRGLTEFLQDPQYEVLTMTDDGEDSLYAGSVTDANGDHHVLFASNRMLTFMSSAKYLHGDGTVKVIPALDGVEQLFCIVTTWRYHVIPLAWVLMESRTQVAYEAVLSLVFNQLPEPVRVQTIISDFERAQQNAWEAVFETDVQGCLWHLCRAYVLKAVRLGMGPHLRNIPEVREILRLCCALPLLPTRYLTAGYLIIVREAMAHGRALFRLVRQFLSYVLRYWIRSRNRRRWMCVYKSFHRTNNASESHNRVLKDILGIHTNIYLLIRGLITIENNAYSDLLTLRAGRAASRKRRASAVSNDRRLRALTRDMMRNPPGPRRDAIRHFLHAASHRIDNIIGNALDEFNRQQ